MIKKVARLAYCFFVQNGLGWLLAVINLTALHFFVWYLEGGLHHPAAIGCVEGKFTLISTFRYYREGVIGVLSDMASGFVLMFNLPAIALSNFLSDVLFAGTLDCVPTVDLRWNYSIFYQERIGLSILFVVFQWLIVGAVIKRLIRLVKESDQQISRI